MLSRRCVGALILALVLCACDSSGSKPKEPKPPMSLDGGGSAPPVVRCVGGDADEDLISGADEGEGDADGDGDPNAVDRDSDGDGIDDIDEAGDADCTTTPVDTDADGTPDFLDTDANGDGTPDREQGDDLDEDGTPDFRDADVDGDGIPNADELDAEGAPVDSDGDGTPDVFDLDSDGDTILDADEGRRDPDEDGIPNFRDIDSDDDGIDDSVEAGDSDPATPPDTCDQEVDPVTGELGADGLPDFMDADRDNDGASDADETAFGTALCGVDTDGDGFGDLVEIAREQVNCPDGMTGEACGCATNIECGIPDEDFFVILPFGGPAEERDLDFGTDIRVADVFFLTDTTGSMDSELELVKNTVATPGSGMIDRISETIPDAWFGGGQHDDFPFGGYGGSRDEPLIRAIVMTPPDRSMDVQTAFSGMELHGGSDGPESATEALYQVMSGEGASWMYRGSDSYELRRYVGDCLDGGWGAACFREGALPIVVHFTDYCSHNGPPGESESCSAYEEIVPAPATWTDAMRVMNARGAKYIGINTDNTNCAGMVGPDGRTPCYFMSRTAEETGSIDLDGNALVYDLPDGGGSNAAFIDQVVSAVETVATRVPLDVDTALRDDDSDPLGVDATRFIKRRQPACRAIPPTTPCWTPPEGVDSGQAVAAVDESTFFGAIPGTSVKFRITFQNDVYQGDRVARVFIAFIDVRGSGAAVLDTRQVFIIVPANPGGPII